MRTKDYFLELKKRSKYSLLAMVLLISGNLSAQNLTDGLILHYDFDNLNSEGLVLDISGNNKHATAFGAAALTDGIIGQAVHLKTPASPAADYIRFPEKIVADLNDFSISTWVKLDSDVGWGRIFDFGVDGGSLTMFLTSNGDSGKPTFCLSPVEKANERKIHAESKFPVGEWLHLVITVDNLTQKGILYLNGEEVGRNDDFVCTPADMGETPNNYIGKSLFPDPGFNGMIDDFRIYNRSLSGREVWGLQGYTDTEIDALELLKDALAILNEEDTQMDILGDNPSFNEIEYGYNLNLITNLSGLEGVKIEWASSSPEVIASDGTVAPIDELTNVTLTATLSHPGLPGKVFTKEFPVTVIVGLLPAQVAAWTFEDAQYNVEDGKMIAFSTGSDGATPYKGSFENGASVRTIGSGDEQFTVLDLGNENGYLDMGKEIGEAIYKMANYTMSGYYLVENEAIKPTDNGNFLWTFANSNDNIAESNGYIFSRPWESKNAITLASYQAEQSTRKANHFSLEQYKGQWHHILYSQTGNTGTIYVDGEKASSSTVSLLPFNLKIEGRQGTDYNYLGRSCYASDAYMNKTLIHDFRIYSYGLSNDDLQELSIAETLQKLNEAYFDNPGNNTPSNLLAAEQLVDIPTEWLGATLYEGDKMTLPLSVEGYPEIMLVWTASNPDLFDENGTIIHHFYDAQLNNLIVKLIDKNSGRSITKEFIVGATVKAGKAPNVSDKGKLVHFDFNASQDADALTDKVNGISGELKNEAQIRRIGTGDKGFNVLDLGDNNGYFDMSAQVGQIVANLEDNYTITSFFYIEESYTDLAANGNFLWNFSNSSDANAEGKGYFVLSAGQQRVEMTDHTYNSPGLVNLALERGENDAYLQPAKGEWYFVAITGEEGFVEGERILNYYMYRTDSLSQTEEIITQSINLDMTKTPKSDLLKENSLGTRFNWIGRSCWLADKYLRKTSVYDFRIYNKGLTPDDFEGDEFGNVKEILKALASANKGGTGIENIAKDSPYKVYTDSRNIHIIGLEGDEQIALYDIAGRQYRINNPNEIGVNEAGIYILKINNFTIKVLVK